MRDFIPNKVFFFFCMFPELPTTPSIAESAAFFVVLIGMEKTPLFPLIFYRKEIVTIIVMK